MEINAYTLTRCLERLTLRTPFRPAILACTLGLLIPFLPW